MADPQPILFQPDPARTLDNRASLRFDAGEETVPPVRGDAAGYVPGDMGAIFNIVQTAKQRITGTV